MDTIEAFVRAHHHFFHRLLAPIVVFKFLFLGRVLFFTALELFWPARKVSYWPVIARDFAAYLLVVWAFAPMGAYLNRHVAPAGFHPVSAMIVHWPVAVRVALYFIVGDFGHYWVHRLTHTKYFWRVHKWHHSPTHMYWLAGMRSTALDFAMVNTPYILAYSFFSLSFWWANAAVVVVSILETDWMHMNVSWRLKWLEWIVVTPRYHHIHHSDNPEHFIKNLASLFSIWDRLFGTYLDPDKVGTKLSFGTGENPNPLLLVLGI